VSLVPWLVILLLIGVNALYVAAEFAAVSVKRSRLADLADQRRRFAREMLHIAEDGQRLDRWIAASQIGISLSSLILGAYGQATVAMDLGPMLASSFGLDVIAAHSTASVVVLVTLTAMQVVLGEMVPKQVALEFPTETALLTYLPMRWSRAVYSWFIVVLNGSAILLLKPFGISTPRHGHVHSPDEIEIMIRESHEQGTIERQPQVRLQRALQLGFRPIWQIMVPRVSIESIDIDAPPQAILEQLSRSPYTRLPVCRGSLDTTMGIVHTKEVIARFIEHGVLPPLHELMQPVRYIPRNTPADRVLTTMREQHISMALVVDEFGGVAGLVSLGDLLVALIGAMGDELKESQSPEQLPDGSVRLPGVLPLPEVELWTGVRMDGPDATIGGQIVRWLGRLPYTGEHVVIDGLAIEVEKMEGRAVKSVKAKALDGETKSE
jgi:CBS domain containing-hemolysin-like protein